MSDEEEELDEELDDDELDDDELDDELDGDELDDELDDASEEEVSAFGSLPVLA